MNQNVSNNGNRMKLMSNDTGVERSSGKRISMDSAFSSLLSGQLNKSKAMMDNGVNSTPKDVVTNNENTKAILKKIEPTANKLAVKAPEKVSINDSKPVDARETTMNEPMDQKMTNANVSASDNSIKVDGTQSTESVESTAGIEESVEEGTVKIEDVFAMLEQVIANLINQLKETPDLTQKEPLQEQIELLSGLLSDMSNLKDVKIDSSTFNQIKTSIEQILIAADTGKAIKPEVVEMLKNTFKEIKDKFEKTGEKDFGKVLETKQADAKSNLTETEKVTSTKGTEVQTASNEINKAVGNATQSTTDKKETLDPQTKTMTVGKEKADVQVQTSEHKGHSTTANVDFNAKLESSAIAFSKTEIANQVTKTPLQQSIMDQLINSPRMQVKQTEQGTMMTMKLNPEVLGDVEIKMEIVKGVLQAEIKVESMIVKGAIEASLSDLKNALSDKGYQVESLNVSVGKESSEHHGQQQQSQNERQGHLQMDELDLEKGQYGFEAVINDNQIDYRG